jgi:hypothetical protein
MRIELLAGRDGRELRDVVDKAWLDVAPIVGEKRGGGSGLLRERRDRVEQFVLQAEQIFGRLDDDAGYAERWSGNVIVPDRLEPPVRHLLLGENRIGGGVDLVEVGGADEPLDHGHMWMVRRVQSKAFRIGLEQAGVGGLRTPNHRRIGLERDVDRGDWVAAHGFRGCSFSPTRVKDIP